jgi:sulfite exporter TauE/SafE
MLFGMGRISSYMLVGGLVAGLGESFRTLLGSGAGPWFRSVAGVLIALMGLHVAGIWSGIARIEGLGRPLWNSISPFTRRLLPVTSAPRALALGALWGFLPCGLVYSTLALSLTATTAWQGALTMGYFGLGTLPAMAGVGLLSSGLTGVLQTVRFRRIAGVLLVVLGAWTVAQAWAHTHHADHAHHENPSDPGPAHHAGHAGH